MHPLSTPPVVRNAPIAELVRESAALGITLSDAAITCFQNYIDTLLFWRVRLSLTAAATPQGIVRDHILDSLALCRFIQPGMRVADLGSGAGFPGVPLAIVCNGARFSLVESRRKKANFLREVVRSAKLANVEIIEERAEHVANGVTKYSSPEVSAQASDLGPQASGPGPESFPEAGGPRSEAASGAGGPFLPGSCTKPWDLVVSRAVWARAGFLAVSERLLVAGGVAIAMKGPKASSETLADRRSFAQANIVEYGLITGARHRLLVYRRV